MRLSTLLFLALALVLGGCQQQTAPETATTSVAQLPSGYELVNFGAPW